MTSTRRVERPVCTRATQDVGMAAEAALEAALVLGLELVVELVGDPLAHLGQHRAARRRPGARRSMIGPTRPRLRRSASIGLGHAGVLDLDGDLRPVVRARAVDLAERRERERLLVEVGEQLADGRVELALDDPPHAIEGDRRRARRAARRARPRSARARGRASRGTARASRPRPSSARAGRRAPRSARGPARRRATALAHPRRHDGAAPRGRRGRLVRAAAQQLAPARRRRPATARWCR